jgi:hypothetical protein
LEGFSYKKAKTISNWGLMGWTHPNFGASS